MTETCQSNKFSAQPAPSTPLPTVANAEQLIIVAMNANGPKDLVIKNQDSVTICYGIASAAVHCNATAKFEITPSSFIRIIDINRNKKQSILIIPRSSASQMGKILLHSDGASDELSLADYRLPATLINDALPVERANQGTDLWLATEQYVVAPMFANGGISTLGDKISTTGMLSLQLTRPSTDPPGLQLLGVRSTGVAVISMAGNLTASSSQLSTIPAGIIKLRTGDLNKDGALDVVGATDAPFKFYSALAQPNAVFPTIVPISSLTTTSNSFEIADLDGNGLPGVVGLSDKRTFFYLAGRGDGTFADQEVRVRSDQDVAAFAVQDLNGDAKADLVYTTVAGEIRVLFAR